MAKTGVLGNGPISFFIKATHGQVSIPLSALIFDGGTLTISPDANRTDLSDLLTKGLSQWLNYQAIQGFVVPAPTTPAAQAMVFKAADSGVTGNDVTVEIAYTPGSPPKYTATVTKTDRYTGLTKDNIVSVLGMGATAGTQPGLVRVKDAPTFTSVKTATSTVATPSTGADQAALSVDFSPGGTLTLLASKAGLDGNNIKVKVTVTDAPSGTFSLTATWTTTLAAIDTTTQPPAGAFDAAKYVLSVSAPPPGATFGAPQAGLYVLRGGADAAPPATATATALAAS